MMSVIGPVQSREVLNRSLALASSEQ